jgi:LysM repeat protein
MASKVDMLSAVGTLLFDEVDPPKGASPTKFVAYLTKAPIVVAGYGGWSRTSRPRRQALTEWVGRDSISVQCEFLVDTYEDNQGTFVEDSIAYLEYLAGVGENDPIPPLFELGSKPDALMPHGAHRAPGRFWFVDSISWDADTVIYNESGNRVRAGGTVVVTRFVQDERLKPITVTQKHKSKKKGAKVKRYTVRKGDTLHSIAARKDVYGDSKKWKKIAEANKIRGSKGLDKWIGKEIKIP